MQTLAQSAGFAKWQDAKIHIEEMIDVIARFEEIADSVGVSASTRTMIAKQLAQASKAVSTIL